VRLHVLDLRDRLVDHTGGSVTRVKVLPAIRILLKYHGSSENRQSVDSGSPRVLDSMGSLRSSSFATLTLAVLTSPVFVENAAPSCPTRR
jgi:hypothetical protein